MVRTVTHVANSGIRGLDIGSSMLEIGGRIASLSNQMYYIKFCENSWYDSLE